MDWKTIQNKQLFFVTWPLEPQQFIQDTNTYFSSTIEFIKGHGKKIMSYYPRLAKYHFQKHNNTLVLNSIFS